MARFSRTTFAFILLTASGALAQVNPAADVVQLRKDCTGAADCFTTTSALTAWLWGGGRSAPPSASDRVAVFVGPGSFDKLVCDATSTPTGWVSVIGSGREQTRFEANDGAQEIPFSGGIFCMGGITVYGCSDLAFQDLTAYGSDSGVFWIDGGNATWTDVDMVAGGANRYQGCAFSAATYGWFDNGSVKSTHFAFGSRAIGLGTSGSYNTGVRSIRASLWWYGGDVLAKPDFAATAITAQYGVEISGSADFHAFGTSIRNLVGSATGMAFPSFRGVTLNGSGVFHMHGGIVTTDASASTANVTATGLFAGGTSFAHAHETAFLVKAAGTGTASRLARAAGASIESPFLWDSRSAPPAASSLHGNDLFVDTAAGPGNDEAHLMVYDTTCAGAGGPWRDMAGGACRVP